MKLIRTLPAVAVVCLLAVTLPVRLPADDTAASNEACLTMADRDTGRPTAAASTLERCSALYPDDVELLADVADTYEATEPARAESILKRAIALDPLDGELRLRFGRLLLARAAAKDAREQAVAGLKVQPNRSALLALLHAAESSVAGQVE